MTTDLLDLEKTYIEKLKEIRGKIYEKLTPSGFSNKFNSLGDVYEADIVELANTPRSGFGNGVIEPVKQFQQALNNDKVYWLRIHAAIQPITIEIPDDSYVNKAKFLLSSLRDYFKEKEWLNSQLGAKQNKVSFSEILSYYYGINNESSWLENKLLASKFDCKPQYIDYVRSNMDLKEVLQGKDDHVKLVFHGTTFTSDLDEFRFKSKALFRLDPDGKTDPELVDRYTAILGYNISHFKIIQRREVDVSRYFLTKNDAIGEFKENLRILVKTSNKEINARSEHDISLKMEGNWEKEKFQFNPEIISALINGVELFKEDFSNEQPKFYINWSFLSGVKEKVARILMEADRQMFKHEILDEYNLRCSLNNFEGLSTPDQINVNHKNVISRGNNVFVFGDKNSSTETVQQSIEKIAKRFAKPFTASELYESIKGNFPQYDEPTIRSYTTWKSGCKRVIQNKQFDYIHESLLDKFPEIKVADRQNSGIGYFIIQEVFKVLQNVEHISQKDLESQVRQKFEENFTGKWRGYYFNLKIDQLIGDDFIFYDNEGAIVFNVNELDQEEIKSIGKIQEPAYRRAIKDRTVQILKARDNSPILLKDLWQEVSDLYPKEIAQTNFYKLFYDQELFVKQEIDGKQAVSLQLNLMPKPVEADEPATDKMVGIPIEEWKAIQTELKTSFNTDVVFNQLSEKILSGYRISKTQTTKGIEKLKSIYTDYQNSTNAGWMHLMLREIYEIWNKKTDIYDRRSCLDRLVASYETFVKKLIWNKDEFIGLGGLLNEDSVLKNLTYYHKNYRYQSLGEVDVLKKDMSFALRKLKSMADALRHNMDEEKIQVNYAEGNALKNIQDFMTLYVYTASIL